MARSGHVAPVIWQDHVYTASADEPARIRYLLCHELATGKQLWSREIPGPVDRHHTQNSSASGSVAADVHGIYWLWGTRENVRLEAVSHAGQPRWRVDLGPFVAEHGFGGTPTVCGDGGGNNLLVAVKPPDASSADSTVAYSIDKSAAPYVPTPLESQGRLYLWGDRGVVTCVRAVDGSPLWKGRVGGNYSASPIALGGRIINVSSDGEVVVIADGESFEVLGRTPLGEETRATPAVAGGRLLFRSASHLWALPIVEHTTTREADG